MTKPNGWTDSWLSDVMRDDALDASYHRRDIDADRGISAKADSAKAREIAAALYEALDAVLPYAAKYLDELDSNIVKARAALSAAKGERDGCE